MGAEQLSLSMYIIGYIAALTVSILLRNKYRMSKLRVFLYSLTIAYGFLCAKLGGAVYSAVYEAMGLSGGSTSSIFGAVVFTPVLEIITVAIEKLIRTAVNRNRRKPVATVSIRDTLDMLTPNIFMILLFGKLRCAWAGCCFGFPCSFGTYTPLLKTTAFPVQLFEAASTLLILIVCLKLKETKFFRRGMAYPLTASMYCIARFGWEFARYYTEESRSFPLHLTFWQWACIFVFICSVISIIVMLKKLPSEPLPKIKRNKA